ncbi:MAG: hypothetical protein E6R04_10565 [Spirochaetes bacterium]|nr:MAG: hypothetical protein E6R04_10565 [Spirochaetota bacterium]
MKNNPTAFVFWLQGFFEISGSTTLNQEQVEVIKDHLKLVFDKVTPSHEYPIVDVPTVISC